MSRIAEVKNEKELSSEALEVLRFAEEAGAPDPRMAKILLRSPGGVAFLKYWKEALYSGDLPHRLKEIVRIYLSASHGCAYCSVVRSTLGAEQGVNDELLLKLDDIEANDCLSPQEKSALRFAQKMKAGEADDDAVFDDLHQYFSEEEILELGLFCGVILGGGSFAKLLHVVTWEEVCSLKPSMQDLKNLAN